MTWFDLIVIAVLALSTVFAVVRGGLKEVGTLVALAAAGGAAFAVMKPVQSAFGLSQSFITTALIGAVLAFFFFVALYIFLHIGLKRLTLEGRALTADRIGGGVFGLARGLALIGLGFLAYSYYLDESRRPKAVASALTLPIAEGAAAFFKSFAPEGTGLDEGVVAPVEAQANAAMEGYARGDRSALSEIVTTVTTVDGATAAQIQAADAGADPIAAAIEETAPE